jgi:hypothetical protein
MKTVLRMLTISAYEWFVSNVAETEDWIKLDLDLIHCTSFHSQWLRPYSCHFVSNRLKSLHIIIYICTAKSTHFTKSLHFRSSHLNVMHSLCFSNFIASNLFFLGEVAFPVRCNYFPFLLICIHLVCYRPLLLLTVNTRVQRWNLMCFEM